MVTRFGTLPVENPNAELLQQIHEAQEQYREHVAELCRMLSDKPTPEVEAELSETTSEAASATMEGLDAMLADLERKELALADDRLRLEQLLADVKAREAGSDEDN